MQEQSAFHTERDMVDTFGKFTDLNPEQQHRNRHSKRIVHKRLKDPGCPDFPYNIRGLKGMEFIQNMQAGNMVEMEMVDKKIDRFGIFCGDVSVQFVDAVAGVENENILSGFHKGAYDIPGIRIIPSVRAKKYHSHFQVPWCSGFIVRCPFDDR